MKFKFNTINSLWWVILIVIGLAATTLWWFGREIKSIDQRIENIEKK